MRNAPDPSTHPPRLTAAVRLLLEELAGAGLCQRDAANRAGIDPAVLSRWLSAGRQQRDEENLRPRAFDRDSRRWEPPKKKTSALVELTQAWEHARVGAAMDAVQTLRLAAAGKLAPVSTVTVHEDEDGRKRTVKRVEQQPASIDAAKWIAERLLPDSFRQKPEEATTATQQPTTIVYVQQPVEPDAVPTVMGAPLVDPTTTSTT